MLKKLLITILLITNLKTITDEYFLKKLKSLKNLDPSKLILKAQNHLIKIEEHYKKLDFATFQDVLLKIYTNYDFNDLLEIIHQIDRNENISNEKKFVYHFKFFIYFYYMNHKFHRILLKDVYDIVMDKSFLDFLVKDVEVNGISNDLDKLNVPKMKIEDL